MRALVAFLLVVLACCSMAQSNTPQPTDQLTAKNALAFVKDFANLIAKKYKSNKDLQNTADQLAKTYSGLLKDLKKEVESLQQDTAKKVEDMRLQQKLNLVLELWRIRGSVDLLSLLTPKMLHDITGLDEKTLTTIKGEFEEANSRLKKLLPSWGA